MPKTKDSFLPRGTIPYPGQPGSDCDNGWPVPHIPTPHFPWDVFQEGLTNRVVTQGLLHTLPVILKLPPAAQEEFVATTLDDLMQRGLLTENEVESLRGVSQGRAFDVPLRNSDGSPSLCGILGGVMASSIERSSSGAILGAMVGAGLGSIGGPAGAVVGAGLGGLIGDLLK